MLAWPLQAQWSLEVNGVRLPVVIVLAIVEQDVVSRSQGPDSDFLLRSLLGLQSRCCWQKAGIHIFIRVLMAVVVIVNPVCQRCLYSHAVLRAVLRSAILCLHSTPNGIVLELVAAEGKSRIFMPIILVLFLNLFEY